MKVLKSLGIHPNHKIFKLNTAELLQHQALFPARGETELFDQIINTIGSPNESIWPGFNKLPFFQMYSLKEMSFCFIRPSLRLLIITPTQTVKKQ